METIEKTKVNKELDVKAILIELAFGTVVGLTFIAICGFGELIHDWLVSTI